LYGGSKRTFFGARISCRLRDNNHDSNDNTANINSEGVHRGAAYHDDDTGAGSGSFSPPEVSSLLADPLIT